MTQPPWTYSQLEKFETCPKQYYHLRVLRDVKEEQGPHAEWGERVHTAFENFIKYGTALPEGMTQWQKIADQIGALPGEKLTEHRLALNRDFEPADWKQAWTRGIADLIVLKNRRAVVMDYKTGKRKPSEQLDLYASYVFHNWPEVEQVTTVYVWLKDKKLDKKVIMRTDNVGIWQSLLPRVAKLESAYKRDSWPARPSGLCRGWCPVKACQFNSQRGQM